MSWSLFSPGLYSFQKRRGQRKWGCCVRLVSEASCCYQTVRTWPCVGLPGAAWGPPVHGFLNPCRRELTTRVQVTMRIHLLKLRTVKQELGIEEETGEPRLGCLSSLGSQRKGGFGHWFRELVWDKLPAAHCLRV